MSEISRQALFGKLNPTLYKALEGATVFARAYPKNKAANGELARAVAQAGAQAGWTIEELRTEEGRLDEVFRNLTWSETAKEKSK